MTKLANKIKKSKHNIITLICSEGSSSQYYDTINSLIKENTNSVLLCHQNKMKLLPTILCRGDYEIKTKYRNNELFYINIEDSCRFIKGISSINSNLAIVSIYNFRKNFDYNSPFIHYNIQEIINRMQDRYNNNWKMIVSIMEDVNILKYSPLFNNKVFMVPIDENYEYTFSKTKKNI